MRAPGWFGGSREPLMGRWDKSSPPGELLWANSKAAGLRGRSFRVRIPGGASCSHEIGRTYPRYAQYGVTERVRVPWVPGLGSSLANG